MRAHLQKKRAYVAASNPNTIGVYWIKFGKQRAEAGFVFASREWLPSILRFCFYWKSDKYCHIRLSSSVLVPHFVYELFFQVVIKRLILILINLND